VYADIWGGDMGPFKPHVALNVRNVEKSVAFYRKLFGIEPLKMRPGYAKFDVQNPSLNLSLNESNVSEQGRCLISESR
jgi:catechol 2,3-dioxygenase-like lactoylglutathione lyase family enzyme